MIRTSTFGFVAVLGLATLAANDVRAQGYSPGNNDTGRSTSYLPLGGNMSGFIPYNASAGSLGVQPGMIPMVGRPGGSSVMPGGMAPALGVVRSRLTPIAPLGASGMTMGRSGGLGLMGSGSGMIQRAPAVSAMGAGMTRPPVGNYPFRLPSSLVGPVSMGPSM
jgi:hypothetical protein